MITPLLVAAVLQSAAPGAFDRDSGDAGPDTVLLAPAGSLADRWAWAERSVRGHYNEYWIGWTVPGDATGGQWYFVDRGVPVNIGTSTIIGSFQISGSFGGMSFAGVPLSGLLPARDLHETAILLRYETRNGRSTLTRVHAGSFAFPVFFDGGALAWLGGGDDAGSVPLIRGAYADAEDADVQRDLVSAVAAHRDSPAASPVLRAWLADAATPVSVRRTAANGLARHGGRDEVASLTTAMRNDTSSTVRSAAARALAHVADPATAIRELTRLAHDDPDRGVRRNAVTSISLIDDPVAFQALVAMVEAPPDTTPSATRRAALTSAVRTGRRTDGPTSKQVIDLLQRVIANDEDGSVRQQAVNSMITLHDPALTPVLIRIAQTHADGRTRSVAIRGLATAEPRAAALEALRKLAWEHEDPATQRSAVSTLARMEGDDVRAILSELAERHTRADVRRAALRAVLDLDARAGRLP